MAIKKNKHKIQRDAAESKLFLQVKLFIDKADIECLLKAGAPKDEYDPLSKEIAQAILREGGYQSTKFTMGETDLAYIIAFVFHRAFGQWTRPIRLHSIHFETAKQLRAALRNSVE